MKMFSSNQVDQNCLCSFGFVRLLGKKTVFGKKVWTMSEAVKNEIKQQNLIKSIFIKYLFIPTIGTRNCESVSGGLNVGFHYYALVACVANPVV